LRKVRAGGTILILDRDQPVARLERVEAGARPADRISRLEKAGLVRRAQRPLPIDRLRVAPPTARRSVLEALLEERREER